MSRGRKALHLRTGQQRTVTIIDNWLGAYGVDIVGCADALGACTVLLANRALAPELVFVGADGLAPAELTIVQYARQTWPQAGIVIYGASVGSTAWDGAPRVLVCASHAAVCELTTASPERLVERLQTVLPSSPGRVALGPSRGGPRSEDKAAAGAGAGTDVCAAARPPVGTHSGESTAKEAATEMNTALPRPGQVSRSILTREEIAALLQDGEF